MTESERKQIIEDLKGIIERCDKQILELVEELIRLKRQHL
jgi:hypothetical protein